jgi:hypothetical protein
MNKINPEFLNYIVYDNGKILNTKNNKYINPYYSSNDNDYKINLITNNNKIIKKNVSRFIYETFNGPIDIKDKIIFIDNDNSNFNISNLKKVKRSDVIKINNIDDKILTDSTKKWKNIPGYDNYKISSDGICFSLHSGILKPSLYESGYYAVTLSKNNKPVKKVIHRLVFEIFNNKKCEKNMVIDHIDRNKLNNNITNLREVSRSINGLNVEKKQLINHETIIQYDLNNNIIKKWNSRKELMEKFIITNCNNITNCCLGKQKTAYKFIWKYEDRDNKIDDYIAIKNIDNNSFSKYKINENGTVINLKGQIIQPMVRGAYLSVNLITDNNINKSLYVHRLVAYTFIKNINNKNNTVNHIDKNKLNNNINNLEWVSPSDNTKHSLGKKINMIEHKSNEIIKQFNSIRDAYLYLGRKSFNGFITDVCNGKKETYLNYKWSWV